MNQEYTHGIAKKMSKVQKANAEKTRTVPFIVSTASPDRHGTVINMSGWKLDNFVNNPIAGYQHNVYGDNMCGEKDSPDDIIGKWKNVRIEGDALMMDLEFKPEGRSELADKIFLDVMDGFLNAVSVGFIAMTNDKGQDKRFGNPDEGEDENFEYFFGQELLEVSVVNIPANPEALLMSLRKSTANALTFIHKKLGLKFSDIEKLTIGEVMDRLEGKKKTARYFVDAGDNGEWIETRTDEIEKVQPAVAQIQTESDSLTVAEARRTSDLLTIKHLKQYG
jgi:hypothetical protein